VKKWGNSAAVRIPSSVLRASRLDVGAVVNVREEAGRIVIETYSAKSLRPQRIAESDHHEKPT
jgi:antitoxin MazE